MRPLMICAVSMLSMLALTACADERWVHATKTEAQARQDWNLCKTEVLSRQEHRKETMASGINLSGCMQSKGYSYQEEPQARAPNDVGSASK